MLFGINSMSVQSNLSFLLNQHSLNANSLSEKTDGMLTQPTTRRILNGESENIRDKTLEKYAKFFNVSLSVLKYGDVEKNLDPLNGEKDYLTFVGIGSDTTLLSDDDIELPSFKEVSFCVGNVTTHKVKEVGAKMRFSKSMLKHAIIKESDAACAINNGSAMDPTILDGATVAIDKSKQQIKDGKIYAFDHGGLLRVCRLYRQPYGAIKIVHDNKEYPDEILTAEQWDNDVNLLGWVFWWSTLDRW